MNLLERGKRFSRVIRCARATVILGGGPSLTQEQCAIVERWKAQDEAYAVIAINNAYLWAPWADLCYFPDGRWWEWHARKHPQIACLGLSSREVSDRFNTFAGQKCTTEPSACRVKDGAVHVIGYDRASAWSDDREQLARGDHGHAGLQAINLAALACNGPIYLLGYDAKEPAVSKQSPHWHGDHPTPTPRNVYAKWRRTYALAEREIARRGISVFNCSPGTAIESFPQIDLGDALAVRRELAAA